MLKQNQFGIKSLFFLTVLSALTVITSQYLLQHKDESMLISLIFAIICMTVGLAMICLSTLFAFCISVTNESELTKRNNLIQCFHMFLFGLAGVAPAVLLALMAILS